MKQSTSKRIKIIAIIFLSLIILVSLLNICDFFFIPKSSDTAVLNKSIKLHGNENCYYIGNDFYVTDSTRGFVQIFDSYGSFKTGYSFPTNGGTAWFGAKNNTLYCYCVRTDTLFTISDSNIINQQTAYYANPEAFASDNELSNNQQIKINNNVATLHDNSTVVLNVNITTLPLTFYVISLFVCLILILIISEVFSKMRFWRLKDL